MSNFILNKHHLREVLLHYFIAKKSAAETYRLLVDITVSMLHQIQLAKNGFDDLKMMILTLRIKNMENHPKNLKTLNWKNY